MRKTSQNTSKYAGFGSFNAMLNLGCAQYLMLCVFFYLK